MKTPFVRASIHHACPAKGAFYSAVILLLTDNARTIPVRALLYKLFHQLFQLALAGAAGVHGLADGFVIVLVHFVRYNFFR